MRKSPKVKELFRLRENARKIKLDAQQYITDVESFNDNNPAGRKNPIPVDRKMRQVVPAMEDFIRQVDEQLAIEGWQFVDTRE
jgi:hypothetical protein